MKALLLLPFLAAPALAQDATPTPPSQSQIRTFQPPQGCTAYLTVQMASCTVSHHFTCDQDPAGVQRRVDMDEGGVTYFGAIDGETQWLESHHVLSDHTETLGDTMDPANFDELTSTGHDSFDFITESPEIGQTRYAGEDRLTGETAVIDGVTLERTEYSIVATTPDGTEAWRGVGHEYINRDWRMFLSGISTYTSNGESNEADDTPVEFVQPGERGFLSSSPKHGCGAVMSSFEGTATPAPEARG